jgi:hypothetical protein
MRPVQLTYDPPAMPHVCIKCGAHAQIRDWFVDIGAEVEWEGYVYLCNSCLADIIRVTPDFLSVEAHKQIVAEYQARMDELSELKKKFNTMSELWFEMTGNSLEVFMDNLVKVNEYARMELSRTVFEPADDFTAVVGDSSESESSDNLSDESESDAVPDIIFS